MKAARNRSATSPQTSTESLVTAYQDLARLGNPTSALPSRRSTRRSPRPRFFGSGEPPVAPLLPGLAEQHRGDLAEVLPPDGEVVPPLGGVERVVDLVGSQGLVQLLGP